MSISARPLGETETGDGPAPHEDLTIAEQLETMRVPDEDRPSEQCFINDQGEKTWLGEDHVSRFIVENGAEFSSDYQLAHGADWTKAFFDKL